MKKKILVANRSEIACRVFQAAREMGLATVGIVAPGDEEGRHVTYADEVIEVTSYLDIQSVVAAAQKSKAHLIHPGYGFLSERPAFARAMEASGFGFIGPRPETMELLGGKISAKELAAREGVPTLPWAKVGVGEDILERAKTVGFPLLLKASAGGGGKGMRRVDSIEGVFSASESASAEAMTAFGDGTLFLERLVEKPRHIEVQVFGDGNGHGVHLYERECTLQRRHQKVWEEATAPHLPEDVRNQILEAALKLVRATRYRNAGTVEFLVDSENHFYFLEINARLQVEHPVTELVTGVDLVHTQIHQALDPSQVVLLSSPSLRGHAIEVRFYAEDPAQGFVPCAGKVARLRWPTGTGIRVESGIEEGQAIGTQFDPMLGKLIVSASSRPQAVERMRFALEETVILGLGTNQAFLRALTLHPAVQEGKVDTGFLERELQSFLLSPSDEDLQLLVQCRAKEGKRGAHPSESIGTSRQDAMKSPWFSGRAEGARS